MRSFRLAAVDSERTWILRHAQAPRHDVVVFHFTALLPTWNF
jgi:hypothetical protein